MTAGETAFDFTQIVGVRMFQQSNLVVGKVTVTQANIKYGHIYLSSIIDGFPTDVIGGSNKRQAAQATLSVDWGGNSVVETDIDGTKKIFRARGWVRDFYEHNSITVGDILVFRRNATHVFKIHVQR